MDMPTGEVANRSWLLPKTLKFLYIKTREDVFILGKSPKGLHKIAQGNALGLMIKYLEALKGRNKKGQ